MDGETLRLLNVFEPAFLEEATILLVLFKSA